MTQAEATRPSPDNYTVERLCRDYLEGYVEVNRKTKGAVEVARIFKAMLGPIADRAATTITRAEAFDLLESYPVHFRCSQPAFAWNWAVHWHYALDAGRLPENTANWWKVVLGAIEEQRGRKVEEPICWNPERCCSVENSGIDSMASELQR